MADAAPAAASGPPPTPAQELSDRRAPQRDSVIAAMAQLRGGASPAPTPSGSTAGAVPAHPSPAPAAESTSPALPVDSSPAAAGAGAAGSATDSQPAQGTPAAATAPSDQIAEDHPALVALRKQEQHVRRQLAAERDKFTAEMERDRAAHQARVAKAESFESRVAHLKSDPAALIDLLTDAGFGEADFEPLGKLLYGHSPEGQKQPGYKTVAHQSLAQRQLADKVAALEKQLGEATAAQARAAQEAQVRADLDRWYAGVTKAVGDDAPLARAAMAKNPDRVRERMTALAERIWTQSGPSDDLRDAPTPAQVIRAYEAERAAELEELGIDPKTAFRPAAPPRPAATLAPSAPAAVTTPPAPPAPSPATQGTPPGKAPPMTREEFLAELARRKAGGEL